MRLESIKPTGRARCLICKNIIKRGKQVRCHYKDGSWNKAENYHKSCFLKLI